MSQIAIVHFVNYKKGTQSRAAMRGVMLYVMQTKKTEWEGERLISGINCQPESVCDDFLNTKLLYHKDKGVMFYHMVQSFPKGAEINPRMAHEAARQLTEYFEGCEVLVCTHIDRDHIHSHCIINSVNFETGKKLHMAKEEIRELMRRNDMICQEMGLPVFEAPTQKARGMRGSEYHTALKGESWKLRLANTIDECMKYAASKEEFISLMESERYVVRWEQNRKSITYTTPEGMKCRDNKLHEEKYLKEVMEDEFGIRAELAVERTAKIAARVEADEPTERRAARTDHAHRDPMSDAGSVEQADTAGRRDVLGAANDAGNAAQSKIPYRPDSGAKLSDGDSESPDGIDLTYRTGWEQERAVYLQMAGVAAGLRPLACGQMGHAGADFDSSTAGHGVRDRDGAQQHPKSLPLTPLYGLAALGALMEGDSEDAEECYRRIMAEQEAKNIGAVLGLAAGAAIALTKKPEEEVQAEEQQTMGGL